MTSRRGFTPDLHTCRDWRQRIRHAVSMGLLAAVLPFAPLTGAVWAEDLFTAVGTPSNPAVVSPQPGATARLNGFRSARFGMDEDGVRQAISTDFGLEGHAVHVSENPEQRTPVLTIVVQHLASGKSDGRAAVHYVFGYRSHLLSAVHITWETAQDPANTPSTLLETGSLLQAYFERLSFPPGRTATNAVMTDGSVILFRGMDPQGHTVALLITGQVGRPDGAQVERMTPSALILAYTENPERPDIFRP
ncbi:MAG: hypothetical protein LKE96_02280 [Acetobacter peroxydans]|nr:hypothetical protein [Acetobacter peroxydans]